MRSSRKRADALAGRGGLDFRAEFCSRGLLDDGVVERALDLVLHAEHVRELVLENPLREEGADATAVDDRERKRRPARVDGGENDGVEVERLPDEADAAPTITVADEPRTEAFGMLRTPFFTVPATWAESNAKPLPSTSLKSSVSLRRRCCIDSRLSRRPAPGSICRNSPRFISLEKEPLSVERSGR